MAVTVGGHRLWAHRAFKARFPLRLFLAFFQTMAFQVIYFYFGFLKLTLFGLLEWHLRVGSWSPSTSQIFGNRCRPAQRQTRVLLLSRWLAAVPQTPWSNSQRSNDWTGRSDAWSDCSLPTKVSFFRWLLTDADFLRTLHVWRQWPISLGPRFLDHIIDIIHFTDYVATLATFFSLPSPTGKHLVCFFITGAPLGKPVWCHLYDFCSTSLEIHWHYGIASTLQNERWTLNLIYAETKHPNRPLRHLKMSNASPNRHLESANTLYTDVNLSYECCLIEPKSGWNALETFLLGKISPKDSKHCLDKR